MTASDDFDTDAVSERDVAAILADAHALAFPRYPGTPGDRRAIAWVAARMAAIGLEVEEQAFSYDLRPAWRALRVLLVALAAVLAAAGWLVARAPGAAALLLALGLLAGGVLLGWSPWLERLYRRAGPTRTANVVGRRRAADKPRLSLILMAHHDSKSQNLPMLARGALTLLALLGALALAAALAAAVLPFFAPAPSWLGTGGGVLAACALLILSTLRSGDRSPGGVDNAGAVALVLFVARRILPRLAADVELIVLSPGAEEDHMVGAMRWLDAEAPALAGRPVWALNVDGAGAPGRLALLERFGLGRRFSPSLSTLARRCAAAEGIPVRGVWMPPAMGIDAIPFAHRGIDCLTLSSGSLDRATLAVHSPRDVAANLDGPTLARAARLLTAMSLALAAPP